MREADEMAKIGHSGSSYTGKQNDQNGTHGVLPLPLSVTMPTSPPVQASK